MKTYQDLLECVSENERISFIDAAIADHRSSEIFRIAEDAKLYAAKRNVTINNTVKQIVSLSGNRTPDPFAANYKCTSNFFGRFITQQVQFLLGNGVTFENEDTKNKLGKDFDIKLQKAGKAALIGGCSFGFLNHNRVEIFEITEFVPLYDEESGALCAGIRFFQVAPGKPIRITLYEADGYTEYIKKEGKGIEIRVDKRAYIHTVAVSKVDGERVIAWRNYPSFPIVPLWANDNKQSELVGIRSKIDAYDLIMSGFVNDIDEASYFYWTLENCGGMTQKDLADFLYKMRTVHAANVNSDDGTGAKATAHTMDVPVTAREAALERLKKDLYEDYMALDVNQIAAGNVTATQINAAYEPLNEKADAWEYSIIEFIHGLLALINVEDEPSFKRSMMTNQTEYADMVLASAEYLDEETIINKLPFLTPEEAQMVIERRKMDEIDRFADDTEYEEAEV